jgi:hypothetical protein
MSIERVGAVHRPFPPVTPALWRAARVGRADLSPEAIGSPEDASRIRVLARVRSTLARETAAAVGGGRFSSDDAAIEPSGSAMATVRATTGPTAHLRHHAAGLPEHVRGPRSDQPPGTRAGQRLRTPAT